jgi:3-hydroxymyristoyl/3-hydroxydecanoyl-(acyl carrier protein) dehydratase
MSFLFVDKILTLESGKRAIGIKQVSEHDIYLKPTHDGRFSLFSCIIGEAMGQLASWTIMKAKDFTLRPVAGVVGEVKIFGEAYIGDTILLESTIEAINNEAILYHSVASVAGKTILTIRDGLGPLLPIEQFNDPEWMKQYFAQIYQASCEASFIASDSSALHEEGVALPLMSRGEIKTTNPGESLGGKVYDGIAFDTILDWDKGKRITAQKTILPSAPYFADHFPLKPVLPLSLLLESKLQLAYSFLRDYLGPEVVKTVRPSALKRVKMNEFVQPGNQIVTTMTLKEETADSFLFAFRSELAGKRVCIAEAEFAR